MAANAGETKVKLWEGICYPENMRDDWQDEIDDILQVPFAYAVHVLSGNVLRPWKQGMGVWGCLHPHHCLKSHLSRFCGHLARRVRLSGLGHSCALSPCRFGGCERVSAVAESRLTASNDIYVVLRLNEEVQA